jgi:hypothetical protein
VPTLNQILLKHSLITEEVIMPRRKKNAVRKGHGVMCNICGTNCGRGGALKTHLKKHSIQYADYQNTFYNINREIICDKWAITDHITNKKKTMVHILICKIVGEPGLRGLPK